MFKSFIEYGNNITTEEDMFNAFQYKWGMAGKKVILLDAPTINHPILKKNFNAATRSQSTHNIRWGNTGLNIYEDSAINTTEIVEDKKLDNNVHNMLLVVIKCTLTS